MSYDYFMRMCAFVFIYFMHKCPLKEIKMRINLLQRGHFSLAALLEVKNVTEHPVCRNSAGKQEEKYKQYTQTDTFYKSCRTLFKPQTLYLTINSSSGWSFSL